MEDVVEEDDTAGAGPPGVEVTSNPYPPRSKSKKSAADAPPVETLPGPGRDKGNGGCNPEEPRFSSVCEAEEGECVVDAEDPS